MGAEISWEKRIASEDLYITGGCTYEEVAKRTGVSVSQLKRWGKEGDWKEAKQEMLESLSAIKKNTIRLRLGLIKTAMDGKEPMQVFAAGRFEELAMRAAEMKAKVIPSDVEISERHFETPGEAIEALEEALQHKINRMVSVPGALDNKGIDALDKAWKALERMKAKYSPEDTSDTQKGLTKPTIDEMKARLLGLIT